MEKDVLVPNPNDKLLCVKVGLVKRESFYEMTRKYWKVRLNRVLKATHVLAVVNGVVKAVYIPSDWKYTDNPIYLGRCEFIGEEDVYSEYIGKNVSSYYGRSQNPVKYINL